jgi:hypothetical protein
MSGKIKNKFNNKNLIKKKNIWRRAEKINSKHLTLKIF